MKNLFYILFTTMLVGCATAQPKPVAIEPKTSSIQAGDTLVKVSPDKDQVPFKLNADGTQVVWDGPDWKLEVPADQNYFAVGSTGYDLVLINSDEQIFVTLEREPFKGTLTEYSKFQLRFALTSGHETVSSQRMAVNHMPSDYAQLKMHGGNVVSTWMFVNKGYGFTLTCGSSHEDVGVHHPICADVMAGFVLNEKK